MTSQHTTIYTPFADGRPVRDIVEHTPAQVNEAWCRNLLRHTLDSLERQYATGAPHRPITPDTLVMLANGDALLMPAAEVADDVAKLAASLPADLHALALVVHYAITAELPPEGPLGPRLYDNYSEQLTKGLDCCLGPNRRLRPQSIDDMRALLGIEAGSGEVVVPAPAVQEAVAAPVDATAPPGDVAAPAIAPAPVANPVPEPLNVRDRTEAGMLRKPASEDGAAAQAPSAERAAPPAPPLHERVEPVHAAPRKPSAAIPPGAPGSVRAGTTQPTKGRSGRAQRWGMIAGAAIVVLAAGGALVSYMNQNDARDLVPLTLPPAERAATGLDGGETVMAPPSASSDALPATPAATPATDQPAGPQTADSELDATTGAAPDTAPGAAAPVPPATQATSTEAVADGTTYKLLIKPWATVYVDGIERGVSPPIKRLTLPPGRHTIRITNPNFPEHNITVDAGTRETATVSYDFRTPAR